MSLLRYPYTNLHEINLDWIIEQLGKEGMVTSVNGKSGIVTLTGEDIQRSTNNTQTVESALSAQGSAIQSANTKIGVTPLPTTAQTITGAIAELVNQLSIKTDSASANVPIKRSGNIVCLSCTAGSTFSVQDGTNYLYDDGSPVLIPEGYRPTMLIEARENYGNTRIQIQPNGYILMYGSLTNNIARFSACWITSDSQPN